MRRSGDETQLDEESLHPPRSRDRRSVDVPSTRVGACLDRAGQQRVPDATAPMKGGDVQRFDREVDLVRERVRADEASEQHPDDAFLRAGDEDHPAGESREGAELMGDDVPVRGADLRSDDRLRACRQAHLREFVEVTRSGGRHLSWTHGGLPPKHTAHSAVGGTTATG